MWWALQKQYHRKSWNGICINPSPLGSTIAPLPFPHRATQLLIVPPFGESKSKSLKKIEKYGAPLWLIYSTCKWKRTSKAMPALCSAMQNGKQITYDAFCLL
jgi:hypothetical protein